ncbi:MAG: hypothetical protein JXA73_09280 [Acidobacteria bacterium]|nr:hypothetical protein [Acidobacteriota bacterium]
MTIIYAEAGFEYITDPLLNDSSRTNEGHELSHIKDLIVPLFAGFKIMQLKNLSARKLLIFTCIAFAAVAIYLGWIFYSRWRSNQELIQRLRAPVAARDRAIAEAYGGGMKIMSFYAVPQTIRRGETAQLCYGVVNAESVRIEPPPVEDIWPSRSRCVSIAPQKDAVYRFIARDSKGKTKTADLTVTVR